MNTMKKHFIFITLLTLISLSPVFSQTFTVSLKAFLEGPFNGSSMETWLNSSNYLPLSQPYNVPPWNYPGTETVPAIPNTDVADWVLVQLRETPGDASTAYEDSIVSVQAGFILSNGNIVTLDGISPLQFEIPVNYKLFAVIFHRNHIAIMSNTELVNIGGNYIFDFTIGAAQAYGGITAHKELSPGIWGMVSGDGNSDGQVNNSDKNDVWKPEAGSAGYLSGDYSMNGQVDNIDKIEFWMINSGKSAQLPGFWYCGKPFADIRDGKVYNTVMIGSQCWMEENLNIGSMILIPNTPSDNNIIEKYCYDDDSMNCNIYGGLYYWDEMMQYVTSPGTQGICPVGWHVPTDDEWCIMEQSIDPTIICGIRAWRGIDGGGKMKEAGTIHWNPPNTGATNTSGFTAFPAGENIFAIAYVGLHEGTIFWTSSDSATYQACVRALAYWTAEVLRDHWPIDCGLSVRCLKDNNLPPNQPSDPIPQDTSANQPINSQLSWTCTDPENDPLTYDVYFGNTNPPPQVSVGQTANSYDPGTLDYNTIYYWKVVAHDDHNNTTEGPFWSFTTISEPSWTCGDPFTDIRDGQIYNTVQISTQCWMVENLNIGFIIPGGNNMSDNGIIEKYCYENNTNNCDVYGGLYQWPEIMQYVITPGVKGICPDDWHLPTDAEWCTLEQFVDPTITCSSTGWRGVDGGGKLKEIGTTHWQAPNTGATNASGFTALPGGLRLINGNFLTLTSHGFWWSSSESGSSAWGRELFYNYTQVTRNNYLKDDGISVRCVRD